MLEVKRKNKLGLGLDPSARRETFVILLCRFLCICELSLVYSSVYTSEIPTKPPGKLTHPLTLANPASVSTGPSSHLSLTVGFPRLLSTALSWWLPCSVLCSVLSTAFCLLPVSWEISRVSSLYGFRAKTDKRIIWQAPTPTPTEICHSCLHLSFTDSFLRQIS